MKKVIALMAMIAMTTSLSVSAQDAPQQGRQRMTKEEMVQRRTDFMAQQFGLDDTQKQKLLELNTKYADVMPMMGPRPGGPRGGHPGQMRRQNPPSDNGNGNGEMRPGGRGHGPGFGGGPRPHFDPEKIKEYENGLSQIMTQEQFSKYEDNKKARMERRRPAPKDDSK